MNEREKVAQVKGRFSKCAPEELPAFLASVEGDPRPGVKKIAETAKKSYRRFEDELLRLKKMQAYEEQYKEFDYICGVDEVGRGPLAGPVVAGAVVLPKGCRILYLNDSKKLSAARREELYDEIMEKAIAVGIGMASHRRIDEINILQATYEAMWDAVKKLKVRPDVLLNDAVRIPGVDILQVPIIKGDEKSLSIAAASVVAKVTRDRLMVQMDKVYPGYDFASNKGYGTKKHMEAIRELGSCRIHRMSFLPKNS